ncbi:MAG: hypothetical protein ACLSAC_05005 [Enterocloster bolteae]
MPEFYAHCAEYPLECLWWYPLGCGNRYFLVEASGSLDELGGTDTQLACTEITLLKELSLRELVGHAMIYGQSSAPGVGNEHAVLQRQKG